MSFNIGNRIGQGENDGPVPRQDRILTAGDDDLIAPHDRTHDGPPGKRYILQPAIDDRRLGQGLKFNDFGFALFKDCR